MNRKHCPIPGQEQCQIVHVARDVIDPPLSTYRRQQVDDPPSDAAARVRAHMHPDILSRHPAADCLKNPLEAVVSRKRLTLKMDDGGLIHSSS
jgi:hypothetical protein